MSFRAGAVARAGRPDLHQWWTQSAELPPPSLGGTIKHTTCELAGGYLGTDWSEVVRTTELVCLGVSTTEMVSCNQYFLNGMSRSQCNWVGMASRQYYWVGMSATQVSTTEIEMVCLDVSTNKMFATQYYWDWDGMSSSQYYWDWDGMSSSQCYWDWDGMSSSRC